jgi:hypothetical protein
MYVKEEKPKLNPKYSNGIPGPSKTGPSSRSRRGNVGVGGGNNGEKGGGVGNPDPSMDIYDDLFDDDDSGTEEEQKTLEMEEAVKEANRQRDYMQKSVITLKKTLKGAKSESTQKAKLSMQENSVLINECNQLRKENLAFQRKVEGLELRAKEAHRERNLILQQMRDLEIQIFHMHQKDSFGRDDGSVAATRSIHGTPNQLERSLPTPGWPC